MGASRTQSTCAWGAHDTSATSSVSIPKERTTPHESSHAWICSESLPPLRCASAIRVPSALNARPPLVDLGKRM